MQYIIKKEACDIYFYSTLFHTTNSNLVRFIRVRCSLIFKSYAYELSSRKKGNLSWTQQEILYILVNDNRVLMDTSLYTVLALR